MWLNSGSVSIVRHFPAPCFRTPALSAASSSAVHFCLGAPIHLPNQNLPWLNKQIILTQILLKHQSTLPKIVPSPQSKFIDKSKQAHQFRVFQLEHPVTLVMIFNLVAAGSEHLSHIHASLKSARKY